ncbi:MAG: ThiF family adenylyltransferase [Phycisphaeraceae bacterium]|nr:ThiF family adenylyltransferase [Phycisphaeraceae bacterium]
MGDAHRADRGAEFPLGDGGGDDIGLWVDGQGAGRYHRQMLVAGIGEHGQSNLRAAHVLVVGCGALGSPAADLIVRAGVGRVTLVDRDVVELTNLHRQTLYAQADVGDAKAESAARRLREVNSAVRVRGVAADVSHRNVERLLMGHAVVRNEVESVWPAVDVVVDGTDNFETRYLLNDACVKRGVPLVYAGAVGTRLTQMTIVPGVTPCLRCLFPEPPVPGLMPTCDTAGILGPVSAMAGAMEAMEVIRLIVARRSFARGSLVEVDGWSGVMRRLDVGEPSKDCPCCGRRGFEFLAGAGETMTTSLCGRGAIQVLPAAEVEIDLEGLAKRLMAHGTFEVTRTMVRGVLESEGGRELTVFHDGRAVIGKRRDGKPADPEIARAIFARYVGV